MAEAQERLPLSNAALVALQYVDDLEEERRSNGWDSVAQCSSDCVEALAPGTGSQPSAVPDELVLRRVFAAGSCFAGTIAIPGLNSQEFDEADEESNGRNPYFLEVHSETVDELGERQWLVFHTAYGDCQACHLRVTTGAGALSISYSDFETRCSGVLCLGSVDVTSDEDIECTLRGGVQQLVQGEAGFFEPSEEVTHTFELRRCRQSTARLEHYTRLESGRAERVRAVSACLADVNSTVNIAGAHAPAWLQKLPRKAMMRDAVRLCEVQCAKLRRLSDMLDALKFDSVASKQQQLKNLQDRAVTRAASHAANDDALRMLELLLVASVGTILPHELIPQVAMKHRQLSKSYARFDASLRSAEQRLPSTSIAAVLRAPSSSGEQCGICLSSLASDDKCAQLPCKHWYHMDCVSCWLHSSATCPICRRDLSTLNDVGVEDAANA